MKWKSCYKFLADGTIVQRDNFSCAPIAIHNAMILIGVTPPSFSVLYKKCKSSPDGTDMWDAIKAGRKLGLKFVRRKKRFKKSSVYFVTHRTSPVKHKPAITHHCCVSHNRVIFNKDKDFKPTIFRDAFIFEVKT